MPHDEEPVLSSLRISRLGYALGARIEGVDLSQRLDEVTIAEIRKAWLDHVVLCFPGQALEPQELIAFCGQFGELNDNRHSVTRHPDFSHVMLLRNHPEQATTTSRRFVTGPEWHSDLSFTDHPASATFLLAKQLPDVGGDTMFANMYLAYESLSSEMKRLIEPLSAVHDITLSVNYEGQSPEEKAAKRRVSPPVVHPVVRVHPETARKALYVGRRVRNFVGMTDEESQPLLDFLNRHATSYEFVYRHRWSVNDILMWDNRASMHYAVQDYDQLRLMLRCALLTPQSGYIESTPPSPASLVASTPG
jgi:taurine dioxygenase